MKYNKLRSIRLTGAVLGTLLMLAGCAEEKAATPIASADAPMTTTQPAAQARPATVKPPPPVKGADPKVNENIQSDFKDGKG